MELLVERVRISVIRIITGKGDIITVEGAVVEIGAYDVNSVRSYGTLSYAIDLLCFFNT